MLRPSSGNAVEVALAPQCGAVRNFRAPKGIVLANGQAPKGDRECNRKQTADGRAPERHRQG
jgi:hypothetical protein